MRRTVNQFIAPFSFAILFCITAGAQTNVSGFISANTTWNLTGSPYVVTGNILVSHGYTLTIDPGVIVKFNTDKAIQIDGELIAIGTPQNRITFTSNQASPAAGDWAKIQFTDTSVNAVLDANGNYISGSVMNYCDVLYGGSLGFGEIHIESSSPYFNHCTIMHSMNDGIYSHNTSYSIDSSVVKNCIGHGLLFDGTSCGLRITGDSIENNQNGGIRATYLGSGCPIIIDKNYFSGNTTESALFLSSSLSEQITENHFVNNNSGTSVVDIYGNNVLVEKNLFENNIASSTGILNIAGNYDSVRCNRFLNNQTGLSGAGAVKMHSFNSTIEGNIFDGNTSTSTYGVAVTNAQGSTGSNSVHFSRNTIRNNSAPSGTICKFNWYLYGQPVLYLDLNNFTNNTAENIIYITPSVLSVPYDFLIMKYNNFLNPNAQHEFYNNTPYGYPDLHVDSNYWGGTSTQHVDSVIYDYFDDATKSVVYYAPVLTSVVEIDTTCAFAIVQGINNMTAGYASTIFPNPATTHLTIVFEKFVNAGSIEIFNVLGETVLKEAVHRTSKTEISLQNIKQGLYIVKLNVGEKQVSQKLIIQ